MSLFKITFVLILIGFLFYQSAALIYSVESIVKTLRQFGLSLLFLFVVSTVAYRRIYPIAEYHAPFCPVSDLENRLNLISWKHHLVVLRLLFVLSTLVLILIMRVWYEEIRHAYNGSELLRYV